MWCCRFSRQCVVKSVARKWSVQMLLSVQMLQFSSDAVVWMSQIKTAPTFPSECCQKSKNKSNSIYFTYLPTLVDLPNPPILIEDTLHQISFFRLFVYSRFPYEYQIRHRDSGFPFQIG